MPVLPPELAAFRDWMTHQGWVERHKIGRSSVWCYIPTGSIYRLPEHARVNLDRCRDEVLMLSPGQGG